MNDVEYMKWLRSSGAVRCILVEAGVRVNGVELTRYLSSANFIAGPTDTPANLAYQSVLGGNLTISERINPDGTASIAWGDIEIGNHDGGKDSWLNDIWANRPVSIFSGDVRWKRSEFRLIYQGTLAGISSRERGVLNLALRDKMQLLNAPISDKRLGGKTDNKDRLIPLCFGECHNVEPLLIDPATLQFQLHDGSIERIIEVRDNGVPVNFDANLAQGTFKLQTQPAGVITVSVQGENYGSPSGYINTIAPIIGQLVTKYGPAGNRLTLGDLEMGNFQEFNNTHKQPVGLYLTERTNVLEACAQLASSVGAYPVMNALGKLRLVKLQLPALGTPTAVGLSEVMARSMQVADRPPVEAAVKIGYCKNWTVQTNLATGIPEQHKNLFALEWLTTTASSAVTAAAYRLAMEPVQIDTLMLTEADAIAEANRRLEMWKQQRTVYRYTGAPALMLEQLGGAQTLQGLRFGMGQGTPGQIVSIRRDWLACRSEIEVLT